MGGRVDGVGEWSLENGAAKLGRRNIFVCLIEVHCSIIKDCNCRRLGELRNAWGLSRGQTTAPARFGSAHALRRTTLGIGAVFSLTLKSGGRTPDAGQVIDVEVDDHSLVSDGGPDRQAGWLVHEPCWAGHRVGLVDRLERGAVCFDGF